MVEVLLSTFEVQELKQTKQHRYNEIFFMMETAIYRNDFFEMEDRIL